MCQIRILLLKQLFFQNCKLIILAQVYVAITKRVKDQSEKYGTGSLIKINPHFWLSYRLYINLCINLFKWKLNFINQVDSISLHFWQIDP